VNATYVRCTSQPRSIGQKEPTKEEMNETCVRCENAPSHEPDYVPFTVSLIGDFTDSLNSIPYRYYVDPVISWISPRYGPKDGGTFVEVYGKNFLNYDQNLRCAFGSLEVQAYYVRDDYIICYSPKSEVMYKELPFSISLNNQQNTKQHLYYVYYNQPQVYRLEPNKGPDTGDTVVKIRGQGFNPMVEIPEMNNHNETFCKFGKLSLSKAKVISSTEIECNSPPSYEDRYVPVEISLNNREWTDDNVLFYYYHPPFIYYIYPKIGPVSGGTEVRITGSNFADTGYVMCKFGDKYSKGEYVNENELKCVSPEVEKPGTVGLSVAIRPDEFSSGLNTKFKYYATPVIDTIEPMCGPERGNTQITMYGKNFPVGDSEYVKCVFNRKIFMNATVMNDHEIKCDSPSVLNYMGVNENHVTEYDLELTLNGIDLNGPVQKFYYYKETFITKVAPIFGPIEGGTTVNITGFDFNQPGACNVTVRFATYQVKPLKYSNNNIIVKSPQANYTGAVVVQVALNGRQFEKDITVGHRDQQNTFYYYKFPFVSELKPQKGPTIGGTLVKITGSGFEEPFYDVKSSELRKLFYRFVNCKDHKEVYSAPGSFTRVHHSHTVDVYSPAVHQNNTIACLQLSYNDENYVTVENKQFSYFNLPNITDINPKYGPLKSNNFDEIKVYLDNYYCRADDCNERIVCKYKSKNNVFFERGVYLGPNRISCLVPQVNIPESFNIEVSFNEGEDYTNNGFKYTFYDPYVIRIEPQMISSKGKTKIKIHGYGFAESGENLKVKFGSVGRSIKCDEKPCIVSGEYVTENLILAETFPRKEVYLDKTEQVFGYERFPVEVSVYNDDFTNNNLTIFYYDEPDIINDLYGPGVNMDPKIKSNIEQSLVRAIPCNLDTMIPIPVNSTKINKFFHQIDTFANYTCKFEMDDDPEKYVVTYGFISSYPENSQERNLFYCQSPVWDKIGNSKLRISLNGYDYSESSFNIAFTDPIEILKIEPSCGPLNGGTNVQIYGTGFFKNKNHVFKWGPQNLVAMESANYLDFVNNKDIQLSLIGAKQTDFKIQKIQIRAPRAPDHVNTVGGLDYISISKLNFLPSKDEAAKFYVNSYHHTNYEYFYYKQPYVQTFSPKGSVLTGGANIMVVGAWFQEKLDYGVRPYCKFGDKIVEGTLLSTVRISCIAPENSEPNVKVPFCVSLNRYDFVCAKEKFTFYNDFRFAKFESMVPQSGPETGGTQIRIFGQNFTNLVTPEEFLCQFRPEDPNQKPKNVPAGFQEFSSLGKSAIICNSPGGWTSGTKASILITFDGQNFMPTNFDFYFFKVDYYRPMAGPTSGGDAINVIGGGFKNSTKVKCTVGEIDYKPLSLNQHKMRCPMPPVPETEIGSVDFGVMLNGIDEKHYKKGFYYYKQIKVNSIFPKNGPNKGNSFIRVYGEGFRNDFPGVELGCKIGNSYGQGELISENEMVCRFRSLPLIETNNTMNFSAALNNYSFTDERLDLHYSAYGIFSISPSSGPISGGTRIEIRGAGFYESHKIRCRFGVPGYFYYTTAQFIDFNKIVCISPEDFKVPIAGQLPFSVPFSIAFNDDEFNPWTESSHFFSFYDDFEIQSISPVEGKTKVPTEVNVYSSEEYPFSMRKT